MPACCYQTCPIGFFAERGKDVPAPFRHAQRRYPPEAAGATRDDHCFRLSGSKAYFFQEILPTKEGGMPAILKVPTQITWFFGYQVLRLSRKEV